MEPIKLLEVSKAVIQDLEQAGYDRSDIDQIIITCDIFLQSSKNK